MDTQKAHLLAKTLMLKHKLEDWRLDWDNAKRRFGCCKYSRKVISLSVPLVELNDEETVKTTILHEIAHALCPHVGHGHEFKRKCIEIGCSPSRTYDSNKVKTPPKKFKATCPECGHSWTTNRRSRRSWHKQCYRNIGTNCKYLEFAYNEEGS